MGRKWKYKLITFIALIVLCLFMIFPKVHLINDKTNIVKNLQGKWKVTEFLACEQYGVSYSYYDHFLGRSITITPKQIITSLDYWPEKIEHSYMTYDDIEVKTINAYQYGAKERINESWFEKLGNQELLEVKFLNSPSNYMIFYITETGEMLCSYLSNYYYMKPYVEAVTNLKQEQLYGQWRVERLISYQNNWKGNAKAYLETGQNFENIDIYEEETGANFYPEIYYENRILISENSISLWQKETLLEEHSISEYNVQICNKNLYQKQNGIYDELGIIDENIQIFTAILSKKVDSMLLDREFIVINDKELIVKIHQGWYLVTKEN